MLRRWLTEVRTDLVTNIVQPGRFTSIDRGLSFFIRERQPNGLLVGILLDDRRDEKERVTILAEQGEIVKNEAGTSSCLENGSIQRHETKQRDPSIVQFDRYAFDLSQFAGGPQVTSILGARTLPVGVVPARPQRSAVQVIAGQFRAELHDRILGPFYPFAFLVIAYTFLGAPSTTRQSRDLVDRHVHRRCGLVAADGFRLHRSSASDSRHLLIAVQYLLLGPTIGLCLFAISRGMIIEPPASLTNRVNALIAILQAPRLGDDGGGAMSTTLARYFGVRFLMTLDRGALPACSALVMLLDYLEMMRRHRRLPDGPR